MTELVESTEEYQAAEARGYARGVEDAAEWLVGNGRSVCDVHVLAYRMRGALLKPKGEAK